MIKGVGVPDEMHVVNYCMHVDRYSYTHYEIEGTGRCCRESAVPFHFPEQLAYEVIYFIKICSGK